jgi:hypothetical protein
MALEQILQLKIAKKTMKKIFEQYGCKAYTIDYGSFFEKINKLEEAFEEDEITLNMIIIIAILALLIAKIEISKGFLFTAISIFLNTSTILTILPVWLIYLVFLTSCMLALFLITKISHKGGVSVREYHKWLQPTLLFC